MAGTKQPSDKSHFILPDLGEGVHEAELIRWRVKPGEKVDEHQTLAEMETDKALVEVPSPWSGVIKELKGNEGDVINVGSVLVTYETAAGGKAQPQAAAERSAAAGRSAKKSASTSESESDREDAGTVVGSVGGSLSVPARFARRHTEDNGESSTGKALATPAVRRIARELQVDINRIEGTGRGGRVTASDVQSFANGGTSAPPQPQAAAERSAAAGPAGRTHRPSPESIAAPAPLKEDQRIPFRGVRRKIAQALTQSVQTAVHFTVVEEADVTALDRKRKEYGSVLGRRLSFLPFIMVAACRALRKHPSLNANVNDEAEEIIIRKAINLGCAVDTDHGLMVPVIADADRLRVVQLADAVAQLAAASRDRTIPREQLVGGTFTISNVGSSGGLFATPIINYPEVAILASGRVYEKVLTRDGMFYAGKVLPLSLSCDHRVVDGAEGARFLNTVRLLLEEPESLIR